MPNPYTPGYDAVPPVLAGRDSERRELDRITNALASKRSFTSDVVVYGPRGNGKSALLGDLSKRLDKRTPINVVKVMATEVKDRTSLYLTLIGRKVPTREILGKKIGGSLGFLGTKAGADANASQTFEVTDHALKNLAVKAMSSRPTLLMVDEAHRVTGDVLDAIRELAAKAKGGEVIFNYVLAGPPSLPRYLRSMNSTFMDRAMLIRVDRLDRESTRTALFAPINESGYALELTDEQTQGLVDQTQGYPHFIQVLGYEMWDAAEAKAREIIDTEVLEEARPKWTGQIEAMYNERIDDLEKADLFAAATAVARAFLASNALSLPVEDISKFIEGSAGERAPADILNALNGEGYLWPTRRSPREYSAGIPSLMDHVLAQGRDRRDSLEREPDLGWER